SSALPEQVVIDSVHSAFNSAGQRCSALRVLCLQDDIAPRVLELLQGAMDELVIGDPARLPTDVGPVIDEEALSMLDAHLRRIEGSVIHRCRLPEAAAAGTFFPPVVAAIERIDQLEREVFGPVLHVLRYPAARFEATI